MSALKFDGPRRLRYSWLGYAGIIIFGITLTGFLFWQEKNSELSHFQSQFERDAALRANLVQSHLNECLLIVLALHSFYAGSDTVERDEFKEFTETLLENRKELQVMGWLPRIPHSERDAFEKRMRKAGYAGFRIEDFVTEQSITDAPEHEEYFPIEYMEPTAGNESKIGLNILSQPIRRAALERARDTGLPAVTELIHIFHDKVQGFNIYIPNYRRGMPATTVAERRAALDGYLMGVFRMADVIAKPMMLGKASGLSFDLIDQSAPPERRMLYSWESRLQSSTSWQSPLLPTSPGYSRKFVFCGHRWEMTVSANQAYIANHYSVGYWSILPAGLGLTLLLCLNLRTTRIRGAVLEGMVHERTMELCQYQDNLEDLVKERSAEICQTNEQLMQEVADRKLAETRLQNSESRLRSILDSTAEAIYGVDTNGNCMFCNRACLDMLGYKSQEELLGKNMHWLIHHSHADGTPFPIEECEIFRSFKSGDGHACRGRSALAGRRKQLSRRILVLSAAHRRQNRRLCRGLRRYYRTEKCPGSLKSSEERLRAIYECSNDAIMLLTEKGFFDCNPAALKIFGFESKEEIIGCIRPISAAGAAERQG